MFTTNDIRNIYWFIYLSICGVVVFSLGSLLLNDRETLRSLLETGGIIESLPALIYLMVAIYTFAIIFQAQKILPYIIYVAFSIFLAGEESAWGKESVLGVQISSEDSPLDIHNGIANFLAQSPSKSLIGVSMVILLLIILCLWFKKVTILRWLRNFKKLEPSLQFVILGLCLLLLGGVDFLQEGFGLPYPPGNWALAQWCMEESAELLASVALLISALAKISQINTETVRTKLSNHNS